MTSSPRLNIVYMAPSELIPYVRNAKAHPEAQVKEIAASIARYGFKVPILIDAQNEIITGHGRLLAARMLGLDQVPVIRCEDLTPEEVAAFRLADNKVSESAWMAEELGAELESLKNAGVDAIPGFTDAEIDILLNQSSPKEGLTDPDAVLDWDAEPVTRTHDLIVLGDHRLLCADCTDPPNIARLTGGGRG